MKYRNAIILLAVAVLLVASVTATGAAPAASINSDHRYAANPGDYDFSNHGTAWVPEARSQFKLFVPKGWGTVTQAKVAGQYWVHIPIPHPTFIAGSPMKLKYVEFCAQSTNGAATKPIAWTLWEYPKQVYSPPLSWVANNNAQCIGYSFTTPVFREDLGISVHLNFANATDRITLYKAWARFIP